MEHNVYRGSKIVAVLYLLCGALATLWASPSGESTTSSQSTETVFSGQYNEAPMLAERVKAAELAPIEDRLPTNPVVLDKDRNAAPDGLMRDMLQIGDYGGTLQLCSYFGNAGFEAQCLNAEPLLARPGWISLAHPLTGNVIDHHDANDGHTEYTFRIREGLKWSDGMLVTTADVLFNYEDILGHSDINKEGWPHSWLSPAGEKYDLIIVDERVFRIVFETPAPGFLDAINAPWFDYTHFMQPRHYLVAFHDKYANSDQLKGMIEEEDVEDWVALFKRKHFILGNPITQHLVDLPVLHPWRITNVQPSGTTEFERNPYYFKVDTVGNQLPYLDHVVVDVVQEKEICDFKVAGRETDLYSMEITALPRAREYQQDYHFELTEFGYAYHPLVQAFNFTYSDPQWQEIVADIRFRTALNLSINRDDIISTFYYGLPDLMPAWIPSGYDPEQAGMLLDEMGLHERDEDGWRLRPDGGRLELDITVSATGLMREVHQLVGEYYQQVGIHTKVTTVERATHFELRASNALQIDTIPNASTVSYGLGTASDQLLRPNPVWSTWYESDGTQGWQPPEWFTQLYDLAASIGRGNELDEAAWNDALERYHDAFFDLILQINITYNPPVVVVTRRDLGNVFVGGQAEWVLYSAEQLYRDRAGNEPQIGRQKADPITQ